MASIYLLHIPVCLLKQLSFKIHFNCIQNFPILLQKPYMKSIFLLLLLTIGLTSFAQLDTMRPAYQRYPTVPSLQLILEDSATKYTKADMPKNKAVLLMVFSPDCEHCKQEAAQIAAR